MRYLLPVVLLLIAASGLFIPQARAQEEIIQEPSPILEQLESKCDEIRTTLRRIHTNDALTRVNIGQIYAGTSGQLMARLNSRLALNSINSTELVDISSRFDIQRSEFSNIYKAYESSLSALLKVDCKQRPAEFYALLLSTRDARANLSEAVKSTSGIMGEYQVGVEKLKQSFQGGVTENEAPSES